MQKNIRFLPICSALVEIFEKFLQKYLEMSNICCTFAPRFMRTYMRGRTYFIECKG